MNSWLDFWGGFMIGTIVCFAVIGVIRVWEKRGPTKEETFESEKARHLAQFEDFDIDYNKVAMPVLDPELAQIYERLFRKESFVQFPHDTPVTFDLVPRDMWEKNLRAFEYEQRVAMSITRESRGYGEGHCNDYHPGWYYYCQKNPDHIDSTNPQGRRHGYAGVFWD